MKLTIGLEIHLKLATDTKAFCGCKNSQDFDNDTPNTYVCPTCTGQPGALPVVSQQAIQKAVELGTLLGCNHNIQTNRDRKSYFYPDSPAGYQITQLYNPINIDGQCAFRNHTYTTLHTVNIAQAHLENDTAKIIHMDGKAYLDFNRSGTPLVEIVTKPDFHDADEVTDFLKELQRLVKWNNIAYADLEKGQMRVDVNLSVSDTDKLGARVEIKNMNSFAAIRRAIEYEYNRHVQTIQSGGIIEQTTVGRDDAAGTTYSMRSKEDSMDYRYFLEPDLPTLDITKDIAQAQSQKYIIPSQEIKHMIDRGFNKEQINALVNEQDILLYFEQCIQAGCDPLITVKWMAGLMMSKITTSGLQSLAFAQSDFIEFCKLIQDGSLSEHHAKTIIEQMLNTGKSAPILIQENGFDQTQSIDLNSIIQEVIQSNPKVLEDYKGGKPSAAGFFIGQVMKATKGQANPQQVKEQVEKFLTNLYT